jgi:hypothetical protein
VGTEAPLTGCERSVDGKGARGEISRFRSGDLVVGQFLGDQDLLIADDAGAVLVALPLDGRADWYRPARNIAAFLGQYVTANGAKFWEQKG